MNLIIDTSLPSEHSSFIEAVERWLRDEVAPAYDRMQSDPTRGVPADKVFTDIRARHAVHVKTKA